ncbi:unnamed protein product [Blepharisma stoltei]|uniref:Uncharacterized protein n=1 Tax=Blepharisma stoltei TaxID=1481888 RepID=A0AAU9JPB9_9CILI|nr:unnamed protein product [Blepharisma stoltei]
MESAEIQWLGSPGYIGPYREDRDPYTEIYNELKDLWLDSNKDKSEKFKKEKFQKNLKVKVSPILLNSSKAEELDITPNSNSNETSEGKSFLNPVILPDSPTYCFAIKENGIYENTIKKLRKLDDEQNNCYIFGITPQLANEDPESKETSHEMRKSVKTAYRLVQLYGVGSDAMRLYMLDCEYSSKLRIFEAIQWLVKTCDQHPNQQVYHGLGFSLNLEELRASISLHKKLHNFNKLDYDEKCEILAELKFEDRLPWTYEVYTELIHRYLTTPKNEYFQILNDIITIEMRYSCMPRIMNNREWMILISDKVLELANKLARSNKW